MNKKKLNIVLFALTGFGNRVLEALLDDERVQVTAVFTVKYETAFPHYAERQLLELCAERQVKSYYGVKVGSEEGIQLLSQLGPDLIIVATFKQILTRNVLELPELGVVNLHPSLLPLYRGPCPSHAALLHNEKVTGITAHYVTEQVDDGDILLQRSIDIQEEDNDGKLRQKLAALAGRMIPELVGMFADCIRPVGTPQDHGLATFAPKPMQEDGFLDGNDDIIAMYRKVKAFNPMPGTSILVGDSRIPVDDCEMHRDSRENGMYEDGGFVDVVVDSQAIRLFKCV